MHAGDILVSKPLVYVVIQFVIFVSVEKPSYYRLVRVMCRYLSRTTFLSVLLATNICSIIYILRFQLFTSLMTDFRQENVFIQQVVCLNGTYCHAIALMEHTSFKED